MALATGARDPDHHRITCLVDNTAGLGSRLWGEHGSAFLIESGDRGILFDTGQSGEVFAHNLSVLGLNLVGLRAIVLSHGHYDHVGGLDTVLSLTGEVDVVAHPAVFNNRFARSAKGEPKPIGFTHPRSQLEPRARWRLEAEPLEVAPGVWATGEIPRTVDAGHVDDRLVIRQAQGWVPDPLVDDQALVLTSKQGLTLLLGCCHAGLLNTLSHVERLFERPVRTVIGGTHLGRADEESLVHVMTALERHHDVESYRVGHCTGPRGLIAFTRAFGLRARSCHAGFRLQV